MFIRKRTSKLKNGKVSTRYQAVVKTRRGDKKVHKAISLGEYADPFEALVWARKCLERTKKNVEYPIDQYKEIRHSARYNRPVLVSLPVETAKKRRLFWVKLYREKKAKVEVLEKLVSDLYWEKRQK